MNKIRPFQRRMLIIALLLLALAAIAPRVTVLNQEYSCLRLDKEDFDRELEEPETQMVTVRLHGIYLSMPIGNDRYYGTLHILVDSRETTGGKFEPLELGSLPSSARTKWGSLFYYSEKRNVYESLGSIYCDLPGGKLLITSEDDVIACPAESATQVYELWDGLTQS